MGRASTGHTGKSSNKQTQKTGMYLDANSLALEQILNSHIEQPESHYQTFNDVINSTVVTQTQGSN